MTKPHTTLSEAVRAMELPNPDVKTLPPLMTTWESEVFARGALAMRSAAAALVEQDESNADEWRRLALQFDGHRVQALGHLRALLANAQKHAPIAQEFVSAPPLDGESVLAQRIAALVEQHEAQEPVDHSIEMAKVDHDVELMGVGFLVDGKRCGLNRITWFNRPGDTWLPPPPGYLAASQAAKQEHEAHCNLRWPATLNTAEDHCDCKVAQPTLAATHAGDAKDAARYRWFKDNYLKYGNSDPDIRRPIILFEGLLFEGRWYGGHFDNMNDLDVAIDAAMSPTTTRSE